MNINNSDNDITLPTYIFIILRYVSIKNPQTIDINIGT